MFRRHRIPVSFRAFLIVDKKNFTGIIENISEDGLQMEVNATELGDLPPGTLVKLEFQIPRSTEIFGYSGKSLKLYCKVMWADKITPDGLTKNIGLKIIEVPSIYKELYNILYMENTEIF